MKIIYAKSILLSLNSSQVNLLKYKYFNLYKKVAVIHEPNRTDHRIAFITASPGEVIILHFIILI